MKKKYFPISRQTSINSLTAVSLVVCITIPMWLIGRDTLGEAVIALLYLLPVAWSAYRFGQLAGISAALTAALVFDFLFIPPFFTFVVGSLESWLVLIIFLGIAIVVVGRIQASITKAWEATFKYELSMGLCGVRTQDAVARILARQIQQLFQAALVRVSYRPGDSVTTLVISQPEGTMPENKPDRVLPILNAWGLIGEIQIWRGGFEELPPVDSLFFQNFAMQAARAFERTQSMENGKQVKAS